MKVRLTFWTTNSNNVVLTNEPDSDTAVNLVTFEIVTSQA